MTDIHNTNYAPIDLTDEFMIQLFDQVEEHEEYKPYKAEIDQFFKSRIWKIIEDEATNVLAGMFRKLLDTSLSEEQRAQNIAAIRMMSWWLNLEDNVFAARTRASSLDSETVGGEEWTRRP